MSSVAASARRAKERNPEHYCPVPSCLWRTYNRHSGEHTICAKHPAQSRVANQLRRSTPKDAA